MSLGGLLSIVDGDPQLRNVVSRAEFATEPAPGAGPLAGEDLVAPPTLRPVLAAALTGLPAAAEPRFVLALTATTREADDLTAALGSFLPAGSVACFPSWETLPHERLSPQSDTVGRRIAVLRRLAHPAAPGQPDGRLAVVVAPVRSLLQPIVAGLGDLEPVSLHEGQAFELDDLLARLVEIGYSREDLVSARGEIAVRGGIVDVFPPTEEHPLRVEFFGDTIEEIRYFKVADQRSIGRADNGLWAPPCRELLLTPAVRDRAKELADIHPALGDILGKLAEGIPVEGMEAFAPVLADRMDLLLDYVPPGGIVLACDPERIRARAEDLVRTSQEFLEASWVSAAAGGEAPIDLGPSAFQPIARIRAVAATLGLPWWTIAPFGVTDAEA
ncbi:MAG TPA: transcription-repair coupling factor, partial [Streptosporangiaceae bacterium]